MKTINFSLYGTGYMDGLVPNIEAARKHLPGWIINVYHDGCLDAYSGTDDVRLHRVHLPSDSGMFWRFFGAEGADHAIFRDVDSLITARDAAVVNAWVESDKLVHVIHDHSNHTRMPHGHILGGLWGLRHRAFPFDFDRLVRWWTQYKGPFEYGSDMWFLNRYVWPYALRSGCMHLHRDSLLKTDPWPVHEPCEHHLGARIFGPKAGQE